MINPPLLKPSERRRQDAAWPFVARGGGQVQAGFDLHPQKKA
jgi:hypothetical protein